jgi:hypothetical protein
MDEVIDVFGLACMAHLNGEPSNHVTERDDGHTREVDASYYFRSLAYHEMNRRRGKPPGLVRLRVGFQGAFGEWFQFLFMSEEELAEIIEPIGWAIFNVYSSGGSDYIAVLGKK